MTQPSLPSQGSPDQRFASSFRDPSGYVFQRNGRVFRAVDHPCFALIDAMQSQDQFDELVEEGFVVGTRKVDDPELLKLFATEHGEAYRFLEHDRIETISYPYEWTVSMLADAGLHTLQLQIKLLEWEYALKDATAYNIVFSRGEPLFIDIASIEQPKRMDIWFALGQFNRMFTFPLLLHHHHGWDLAAYFLTHLDGCDVERVAGTFRRFQRWRPSLLLDVTLPTLLSKRANKMAGSPRKKLENFNRNNNAQLINIRRLQNKIRKMAARHEPQGLWSSYTQQCSYSDQAENHKKTLVRKFLEQRRPASVLDSGCNTGEYSVLAAECGARVVAADGDHDAIEILYRRLRKNPMDITPMVVNLSNPSPAIGYCNLERPSFLDRIDVDCVLALALIHHLHVSANLPLAAIRDLFLRLTHQYLVLEFVPRNDVMFERLMKFRVDLYRGFTLDACKQVFAHDFELIGEVPVTDSPRTLLFMERRDRA